jgi:hypothetical protein
LLSAFQLLVSSSETLHFFQVLLIFLDEFFDIPIVNLLDSHHHCIIHLVHFFDAFHVLLLLTYKALPDSLAVDFNPSPVVCDPISPLQALLIGFLERVVAQFLRLALVYACFFPFDAVVDVGARIAEAC